MPSFVSSSLVQERRGLSEFNNYGTESKLTQLERQTREDKKELIKVEWNLREIPL